ncbi:MAG: cobalamin B12-binding domain-containing protein [Nitrospirae bacterium]|nr:cobalamin B12-binding domain-containing protein [Nitrospirota bacterium]MBI5695186.1 cobalamin B12-binding domain-containing protein [Nitrospirota bacterium]
MKIKLISPRMTLRPMDSEFKRRMSPSLALLVLAALTPPEHEVYIEDENAGSINLNDRPDLVGLTCSVDNLQRAYAIADHYRARGIPVVICGTHASASPEEAGRHADAVCVGEAEEVWEFILADAEMGNLMKTYRSPGPIKLAGYTSSGRDG